MLSVRLATLGDAEHMAPRLREADVAEVRARSGRSPVEALALGVLSSDLPLVIVDNDPVAMFGVGPTEIAGEGFVWMLATDDLKRHSRQFLRECRAWLDVLHTFYPALGNVVDERNELHLRWLRWCGFTFTHRHEHYGFEGIPFLEFRRVHDPSRR